MSNLKLILSIFIFFFFITFASSSSYSSSNTHRYSSMQCHALVMFKQNVLSTDHLIDMDDVLDLACDAWLGSGYYPIMMSWNRSTDCCNWNGVTCNHFTGDIIGLDLSCGMLRGTIHPNTTLFNLPHLQTLNLAFNHFTSSQLPPEIGKFSNSLTHLNISRCEFTGQIPSEISFLSKLVSLDLSWNWFDLQIKPHGLNNLLQNFTLLRDLVLAGVNIPSILPIYLNISSSLKSLDLSESGLQGKLPANIFNLQYLEKLDLSGNNILTRRLSKFNKSTSIPLKWLDLSENTCLSGELFNSIGHLKSLNYLDLTYTNLSGGISDSVGHLKSLNTLQLYSCGLMGPLPRSLLNLRHLTTLDLSSNMINGTLPSWLFTFPSLEHIDLTNNMLSGSLPSELFTLRSLKRLFLGKNQFIGKIDVLDQGPTLQTFRQLFSLTHLDLSFNNFRGEWELDILLSSLTTLVRLDLSYSGLSVMTNNVTGYVNPDFQLLFLASCKLKVFPNSLRAMKKLHFLDLSSNEIHGHIPDWAGEIGGNELFRLNLSQNFIRGLPQLRWHGLRELYLKSNLLQGPFPPSICNMSTLLFLDMSNNSFQGMIPPCFGNISSYLSMIDLGNNYFHGTIPNTFKDCGELSGLILNGNHLEGEVPSSLSKCRSLNVLNLGNNLLNDTFPGWLGDLPSLQVLDLKSNNFHGPIITSSTIEVPFPWLQVLDLSHNEFVGPLPQKYFQSFMAMKNAVKNKEPGYLAIGDLYYSIVVVVKGVEINFPQILVDYTIVDLSNNKFESDIPDIIGNLTSLIVLNLSHNSITGRIPDAFGNLLEIESLDLSCNQLTGEIPQGLSALTFLEFLNLSQNHLMGPIPKGNQFDTFEANSFGGNPKLCGLPLPKKCEHQHGPQLEVDGDHTETGFTWRVVMLGYGCGTLLGLVIGYVMLSTRRSKWFNAIVDAGSI